MARQDRESDADGYDYRSVDTEASATSFCWRSLCADSSSPRAREEAGARAGLLCSPRPRRCPALGGNLSAPSRAGTAIHRCVGVRRRWSPDGHLSLLCSPSPRRGPRPSVHHEIAARFCGLSAASRGNCGDLPASVILPGAAVRAGLIRPEPYVPSSAPGVRASTSRTAEAVDTLAWACALSRLKADPALEEGGQRKRGKRRRRSGHGSRSAERPVSIHRTPSPSLGDNMGTILSSRTFP
jgi:hypothetical protein